MAAAFLFFFNPENFGFYPRCPMFVLTGWQCAGCGATRSLHALLLGEFSHAFKLNPFIFFATPCVLLLCLKPALARKPLAGVAAVIAIIAYTVWRNV